MKVFAKFEKWKDIFRRFAGQGVYPNELAFLLDFPLRKFILSSSELVDRLHLASKSVVLEIGPGPGYFSVETAKRISEGSLVLFDIQSEMLKKAVNKLEQNKISNVFPVQGDASILPFNNDTFDVAFLVTVLGEVTDQKKCLLSINKVLRAGGILSITEMKGDADVLSEDAIMNMAIECGFEYLEIFRSSKGFTLNFEKASEYV